MESGSVKNMRIIFIVLFAFIWRQSMAGDDLNSRLKRDDSPLPNAGAVVLSYREAVSAIRDSVVTVLVKHWKPKAQWDADAYDIMPNGLAERDLRKGGYGSGIVLTAEGLVMTNYHVVNGAQEILIRARGSRVDVPAEIVGMDAATDVALLRAKSSNWKAATLASSDQTQSGDVVLALGSPYGLEQTVTLGIVSATGRADIRGLASSLQDFIQTDAAINPGNSGGPLVDGLGRVVGMNTARYGGEGIGLAVPMNLALKVADDLMKGGRVKRGLLGVRMVDVDEGVIAELKLNSAVKGAVVMHVEAGQPADKAGLLPGDVIIAVNGQAVTSRARFLMRMTTLKADELVKLTYIRGSEQHEAEARLIDTPVSTPAPTLEWEMLPGLKVALVGEKLRNKLLLRPDFHALLVLEDFKTSDGVLKAAAGDFILRVNGNSLYPMNEDTPETLMKRLTPKKAAVLLHIQRKNGEEADIGLVVPPVPKQ
jgi:S1-C subfamily serine protease